jgi:hypothetical protein
MHGYRFYFLSPASHFVAASEDAQCADDNDAEQVGFRLLASQTKHNAIEIWDGTRLVSKRRPDQHSERVVSYLLPRPAALVMR